ncbi:MAG TPA: antibiotic biosynthesis monooxygenase family protein [Solirubrobacteraceae bacterium]|nr:antibiotic biosynthesis monooxygenase family protein [Solirubrobacteraceae bacterium]
MFKLEPLDRYVTHDEQIQEQSDEPVILVNIFQVDLEHADEFVAKWGEIVRTFKHLDGFISSQFHRGTAGSGTFLIYSVWESVAHYRDVFSNPDFQGMTPDYPDGTVARPHLFRKMAIENVCVA